MELEIIGVLVAGIIIGLLGKFVAPGDRDNIPIWLTILCGIGGVLIGWFIYTAFGGNGSARNRLGPLARRDRRGRGPRHGGVRPHCAIASYSRPLELGGTIGRAAAVHGVRRPAVLTFDLFAG